MKFERAQVSNINNAISSLHNIKKSWEKSDSIFGLYSETQALDIIDSMIQAYYPEETKISNKKYQSVCNTFINNIILSTNSQQKIAEIAAIGPEDMRLAQKHFKSGFLENIFISVEITAPLYWWSEFTTITVTKHELVDNPITIKNFELNDDDLEQLIPLQMIDYCEQLRLKYQENYDARYYKELLCWLPQSWLITRTWTGTYKDLSVKCSQHRNLSDWKKWEGFVDFVKTLPYANDLIFYK